MTSKSRILTILAISCLILSASAVSASDEGDDIDLTTSDIDGDGLAIDSSDDENNSSRTRLTGNEAQRESDRNINTTDTVAAAGNPMLTLMAIGALGGSTTMTKK